MTNIAMLCRDRYRLTEQAIESLYSNTNQEDFNLTIVDDGSTDFRLHQYLSMIAHKSNATMLRIAHSNHVLSQLKNIGVAWSEQCFGRGDWLYLSDSDVYFTLGWLDKLTEFAHALEPDGFMLFGGQVHPFHQPKKVTSEREVLDGPSWLMRWTTWYAVGPFNRYNEPGPCQSEEYPFCKSLLDKKGRIGVINPHVVYHTGLTQTDGKDAPGRDVREAHKVAGIVYE